jgi:ribosome-binding protein aMBF1 (putative translation factor)
MEKCEWCGVEIEGTKFSANVKGSKKTVCRTCFFLHIKGEYDKLIKRVMGFSLSDEIPFFQKEDKDTYVKFFES